MNKIFFLLMALLSVNAHAILPQDGGAGNVCQTSPGGETSAMDLHYFPLEKLAGPNDKKKYISPLNLDHFETVSKVPQVNLLKTRAGKEVSALLNNLYAKFDKRFAYELINLYVSLKLVYLVDFKFKGIYGQQSDIEGFCLPGTMTSVLLTNWSGITIISRPSWDRLTFETQKVLILHEVLRIAQQTRGWLMNYTDLDIYRLTMAIYSGDYASLQEDQGYVNFKEYHRQLNNHNSTGYVENLRKTVKQALDKKQSMIAYTLTLALGDYLEKDNGGRNFYLAQEIFKLKLTREYIEGLSELNELDSF